MSGRLRASRVGAGRPNCLHCGHLQADVNHLWWECQGINRDLRDADPFGWSFRRLLHHMSSVNGYPPCLWRTGTVPKGFLPTFKSTKLSLPDKMTTTAFLHEPVAKVYTDGSGQHAAGVQLAGYAVHFPEFPALSESLPLWGAAQSVQRAELRAVCVAIERAPTRRHVVSDSTFVVKGISSILGGQFNQPTKHADRWNFIARRITTLANVSWIKAHLPSAATAASQGFHLEDWEGNRVACLLYTSPSPRD